MKLLKRITALLSAALLAAAFSPPVFARESCAAAELSKNGRIYADRINLVIDGREYGGEVYTVANTAYVALRDFAAFAGDADVSWDGSRSAASVSAPSLSLEVCADSQVIEANGRALWCEFGSFIMDGRMYVPVRQIAGAFGYGCRFSKPEFTAYLTRTSDAIEPGGVFYDPDELYWLSRIIEAEAGSEPFFGKLAVGSVIANRVKSGEFPDTVVGVIFDSANGVQFSPVANGSINNTPSADSVLAAKLTLEGVGVAGDALYFLNQALAESFWIVNNCTYVMSVGGHDFYS